MEQDDRDGKFPYIWSVDRKNHLTRLLVAKPIVESCEDRRDFWTMLRAMAGEGKQKISRSDIENQVRQEIAGQIATGLMKMAGGSGEGLMALTTGAAVETAGAPAAAGDYMAPWIDTPQCTACDECTKLNSRIFQYDGNKKAFIKDPEGGPYKDIVRAAEKCTARVIHPGLPRDRSAKDIDKWIKRAEKYN